MGNRDRDRERDRDAQKGRSESAKWLLSVPSFSSLSSLRWDELDRDDERGGRDRPEMEGRGMSAPVLGGYA